MGTETDTGRRPEVSEVLCLFVQGNNGKGKTGFLSFVKLGWKDDKPFIIGQ